MATTKTPVYVVSGASRGIGLGFVQYLLKEGARVFAGARSPDKAAGLQSLSDAYPDTLYIVQLDVASEESIKAAATSITDALPADAGVDVLINNAGIAGFSDYDEGFKTFPDTPATALRDAFEVNVVGTYLLTAAVLPLLRKGELKTVVNISTSYASVTNDSAAASAPEPVPGAGGAMAYRVSKAALSMETTNVANTLRSEGFKVIALHPGWVQTDMGNSGARAFGIKQAPLTVADSVAGQMAVIKGLTPAQNGKFFTWEGKENPW